jgi:hypothetical protein
MKRPKDFPVATHVIGRAASSAGLFGLGVIRKGYGGLAAQTAVALGGAAVGAIIGKRLDTEEVRMLFRIIPEPVSSGNPSRAALTRRFSESSAGRVRETDLPARPGAPLMPWPR